MDTKENSYNNGQGNISQPVTGQTNVNTQQSMNNANVYGSYVDNTNMYGVNTDAYNANINNTNAYNANVNNTNAYNVNASNMSAYNVNMMNNQPNMNMPPMQDVITKKEAKACRHRLEKRWYRRLIELNILIIVVVLGIVFTSISDYKELGDKVVEQVEKEMQESYDPDKDDDKLTEDDIPFELELLFYGFLMVTVGYLGLYYYYAYIRSMSLRITERNFPEVYALIQEYARKLGMKRVPKAYVMQSNGVLNAFSSFIFRKQYIEINAEIFEVAYREHKDMDSLGFVIAHEMAHIYYGHATLHYNIPIWFSMSFPIVGAIASRAREYSADRLAQRISGNDGVSAMFMLMVDRHLYKMVDREDYLAQAKEQKGFFVWWVNLLADHPIMSKRIVALAQMQGNGKLY